MPKLFARRRKICPMSISFCLMKSKCAKIVSYLSSSLKKCTIARLLGAQFSKAVPALPVHRELSMITFLDAPTEILTGRADYLNPLNANSTKWSKTLKR